MRRSTIFGAAVAFIGAGVLCVGNVEGSLIGENDFSGSETLIDFDGFPAPPVGPFTIGDVTFTEASTGSGGPGWRVLAIDFVGTPSGDILTDNAGITDITIDFATPQDRAGMFIGVGPGEYVLSAYDANGDFLESASTGMLLDTLDAVFVGFENFAGIASLQIIEVSGENGLVGGIDNLMFEVPGPSSLAVLAVFGLFSRRRR